MRRNFLILLIIWVSLSLNAQEYRQITSETDSLMTTASVKIANEDFEGARSDLTQCVEIERNNGNTQSPEFVEIIQGLGQVKIICGDLDGFNDLKEAIEISKLNFGIMSEEYKESLNVLFEFYLINGMEELNEVGRQLLSVIESINGKDEEYSQFLSKLINYNIYLTNYDEAILFTSQLLSVKEETSGKNSVEYLDLLERLADYNSVKGNYEKAVDLEKEALEICQHLFGKNSERYLDNLMYYASYLAGAGDYLMALETAESALQICKTVHGEDNKNYSDILNNMALYNYNKGDYNKAISIIKDVLEQKKGISDDSVSISVSLANLALFYSKNGNYKDAVKYGEEALKIIREEYGEENDNYTSALGNVAEYKALLGNYSEAIRLEEETLKILKAMYGDDNVGYAVHLGNLANNYEAVGNYAKAIELGTRVADIRGRYLGEEHPHYALSLQYLANFNTSLGNYKEALELQTKSVETFRKALGENHPDYAVALSNLSYIYSTVGDFSEAIRIGIKAAELKKNCLGNNHPEYANSITLLGRYYIVIGKKEEAKKCYEQALEIYKASLSDHHPWALDIMGFLADYYISQKNYDEAIRICMEALELERNNSVEYTGSASLLNTLAVAFFAKKDYENALSYQNQAIDISKQQLGENHPTYAFFLGNLGYELFEKGEYEKALDIINKVIKIENESLGENHPNSILTLKSIAECFYKLGKETELENVSDKITRGYSDYIKNIFSNLTSYERNSFYNKNKNWFEKSIHKYAASFNSPVLVSNAFNSALMSKGILLSSDAEFSTILKESNDPVIFSKFEELTNIRNILNSQLEKEIAARTLDTDSLTRCADNLERELVELSKEYGDFSKSMSISWNDVQKKLNRDDLAIEFVSFTDDEDDMIYAAYLIASDMSSPVMITLFNDREFANIKSNEYYVNNKLSVLVWSKLEPHLHGKKNIYFAPSGELYNIAIESLPNPFGEGLISDNFNLYRISSTRELALTRNKAVHETAALYGGMKYETEAEYLQNDMKKYPELRRNVQNYEERGEIDLRGAANELPGTGVEIDNINSSMKPTKIRPEIFKGLDGSEASFKNLSGKHINIMHLATHGFYWTETEARKANNLSFLMSGKENSSRYEEDKALTRSGLLFSGANNALRGLTLPAEVEDGILTAKEISELDFRGLDLVVLSACQTGLGEVTGDGVFGLQRGFKKAGANSLLMSLWKVDDRATQMLMTQFYKAFLNGKSKLEALKEAQQYVRNFEEERETDNFENLTASQKRRKNTSDIMENEPAKREIIRPYEDPRYWAAFILLDALN